MNCADQMARYLPDTITIVKTPFYVDSGVIEHELVELRPIDVINTFLNLQSNAIDRIRREEQGEKRLRAIKRIKRLTYFGHE